MDEIQQFISDCIETSSWFHNRNNAQKTFDKMVIESINRGKKIAIAIKNAATQMPEMSDFVSRPISELNKYYSELERLETEIAIANNFRRMAVMRKQKVQQQNLHITEKEKTIGYGEKTDT